MASLMESFSYPWIIMFSVPLAVSGSVLGVYFNTVPLDMLTVLGFIILCGIVVNNAILVVYQALNFRTGGMDGQEAIRESVRSRLRPVFMSTITTILGMLPMCIKGSPGSELYSGLGTAIVGGLVSSTVFTLILVPALLSLVWDIKSLWHLRETSVSS
jgi:HAE1 family hydrophobic/amphiphilic exporter-1